MLPLSLPISRSRDSSPAMHGPCSACSSCTCAREARASRDQLPPYLPGSSQRGARCSFMRNDALFCGSFFNAGGFYNLGLFYGYRSALLWVMKGSLLTWIRIHAKDTVIRPPLLLGINTKSKHQPLPLSPHLAMQRTNPPVTLHKHAIEGADFLIESADVLLPRRQLPAQPRDELLARRMHLT